MFFFLQKKCDRRIWSKRFYWRIKLPVHELLARNRRNSNGTRARQYRSVSVTFRFIQRAHFGQLWFGRDLETRLACCARDKSIVVELIQVGNRPRGPSATIQLHWRWTRPRRESATIADTRRNVRWLWWTSHETASSTADDTFGSTAIITNMQWHQFDGNKSFVIDTALRR